MYPYQIYLYHHLLTISYIYHYLKDAGYVNVVFYNHIDGFYNEFSKAELESFCEVAKIGKPSGENDNVNIEFFDNLNSNAASEVLEKTKVSDIMVKDAIIVEAEDTIGEICELFKISNIGGVPVVKDDAVIGIITERDILRAVKKL